MNSGQKSKASRRRARRPALKESVYVPEGATRFQRTQRVADAWQRYREFYETHDASGRKVIRGSE